MNEKTAQFFKICRHFLKEDIQMVNSTQEILNIITQLGNANLNLKEIK